MRILPDRTSPPTQPTARRHKPGPVYGVKGYQAYRACLRWDFGFTCPFCLLHEADFGRGAGIEGSGLTWIEHLLPQSSHEDAKNEYRNCVYCCRFCNRARSCAPVARHGGRLLDPTTSAWAGHFVAVGDRLEPKPGDADAAYTHTSYNIDDPRKVKLRECRRLLMADHWPLLANGPAAVSRLLQLAEEQTQNPVALEKLISCARLLRTSLLRAEQDLAGYAAIPQDAPTHCHCGTRTHHSLPAELDRQTIELPAFGSVTNL